MDFFEIGFFTVLGFIGLVILLMVYMVVTNKGDKAGPTDRTPSPSHTMMEADEPWDAADAGDSSGSDGGFGGGGDSGGAE